MSQWEISSEQAFQENNMENKNAPVVLLIKSFLMSFTQGARNGFETNKIEHLDRDILEQTCMN